jgi:hypothetical protein
MGERMFLAGGPAEAPRRAASVTGLRLGPGSGARPSSSSASEAVSRRRRSARREQLPQRATQPQQLSGPVPDQRLVSAGHQLDRFGVGVVAGHRAVVGMVNAHDLGQHARVASIFSELEMIKES